MTEPAAERPRWTARQIAWRLFFTAWIVYALHFATDIVREHYPAIALGDRFSFNLEGFCGLHPDLFETPGRGCHIGNNPGISMFAAIPYALARPVIDPLVNRALASRAASGRTEPPALDTPWPNARRFYAEAWRRGLDIKLGLAALVMQVFFMAPASAAAVALMFLVLRGVLGSDRRAMWLALLYAFGTPVFFRTGFLNHNLVLGHIAFAGLAVVWNPWRGSRLTPRQRELLCGLAGGLTILFDYTGVVLIGGLGVYLVVKRWREEGLPGARRAALMYLAGAAGPVLLLWWYQWRAFGHPFYPGQHWMPPVQWIERGYQGYEFPPQPGLLWLLLADHRFGLFVTTPVLLLALAAPVVDRGYARRLPRLEFAALLALAGGTWLFFGGSNYTRLQFNTGIRYLTPLLPLLFVPAAVVLARLRPLSAFAWALLALAVSWPLAMYREVERPLGVLDPMVRTFTGGFTLPVLNTLRATGDRFGAFFEQGVSPLPLFLLAGAVIWAIWRLRPAGGD